MFGLLALGIIFYFLFLIIRDYRKDEKKMRVLREHGDLRRKLWDLFDDPTMTETKWREWLAIAKFSDEEYRALWGGNSYSLEDFVLRAISGDEPQEEIFAETR